MEMNDKAKQVFKRGEDAYKAGNNKNPHDYMSNKFHINRIWRQMGFDKGRMSHE